jgi:hypothetical protein
MLMTAVTMLDEEGSDGASAQEAHLERPDEDIRRSNPNGAVTT